MSVQWNNMQQMYADFYISRIEELTQDKKSFEEEILILEGIENLFKQSKNDSNELHNALRNQMEDRKAMITVIDQQIAEYKKYLGGKENDHSATERTQ